MKKVILFFALITVFFNATAQTVGQVYKIRSAVISKMIDSLCTDLMVKEREGIINKTTLDSVETAIRSRFFIPDAQTESLFFMRKRLIKREDQRKNEVEKNNLLIIKYMQERENVPQPLTEGVKEISI